jgi:hypothetical protein
MNDERMLPFRASLGPKIKPGSSTTSANFGVDTQGVTGLKAFAPDDTDRLPEPPAVSAIAPSSGLPEPLPVSTPTSGGSQIAKYAIAFIIGIPIGLLALGLSHEGGFLYSVSFPELLSELNVIELVGRGVTWIPLLPILVLLPILLLLARRPAITVRWALIVGSTLFALLASSAHELVSRKANLDVYAICLVGFLACFVVLRHARNRQMSRGIILSAVMVAALSASTIDGAVEGLHAKRSLKWLNIHLRGEAESTIVTLLRKYRSGILVVMQSSEVGSRRSEVTFLPNWRVCSLSAEWHFAPDQQAGCS